jgi:hypothetical protein
MTWSTVPCSDATAASASLAAPTCCASWSARPFYRAIRYVIGECVTSSLDGVFLPAISSRRPPPTTPSSGLLPLQPRTSPADRPQLRRPRATPPRCLLPPVLLTISIVTGVPRRRRPDKPESYPRPRALPSPPPINPPLGEEAAPLPLPRAARRAPGLHHRLDLSASDSGIIQRKKTAEEEGWVG